MKKFILIEVDKKDNESYCAIRKALDETMGSYKKYEFEAPEGAVDVIDDAVWKFKSAEKVFRKSKGKSRCKYYVDELGG